MLRSKLCSLLGIEYPIFQGGMAWIALRPDGIYSILTKYFSEAQMQELLREMQSA